MSFHPPRTAVQTTSRFHRVEHKPKNRQQTNDPHAWSYTPFSNFVFQTTPEYYCDQSEVIARIVRKDVLGELVAKHAGMGTNVVLALLVGCRYGAT